MHPLRADLHTLFAEALVWVLDVRDGIDVRANLCGHVLFVRGYTWPLPAFQGSTKGME
jgi:hypothetical protein